MAASFFDVMNELILSLVPLAVAATLQPPQVISFVVLLQTQRGKANALAYLAGMGAFRLVIGGVFWMLASRVEATVESSGSEFGFLVGIILAFLGLLLLVYALRRIFSAPDEDQAAVSWLDKLDLVSWQQAFLVGLAFLALDPKDWITDIAAVNLIADADLSGSASLLTYLSYILLAQLLLIMMLVITMALPRKSQSFLTELNRWMKQNERVIEITAAIIFGLLFLFIGMERIGMY